MDNKILVMIFLLILGKNQDVELTRLNSLGNFLRGVEIDPKYTYEKIKIIKKIGPYFPEHYIPLINKSLLITEQFIKINELVDFMKNDEYQYVKETISIDNNKDRISKIVNTIQKETPKSEIKNMGMMMDFIINMDKYKKMFSMLNSVMSNQDGIKDPTQLISIVAPLLGSDNQKDNEKFKEMNKMMEIMKLLNTPKKETSKEVSKEDRKVEVIERPVEE